MEHQHECKYYNSSSFDEMYKNYRTHFSVTHLNAQSIRNKRDKLDLFFQPLSVNFDVMLFKKKNVAHCARGIRPILKDANLKVSAELQRGVLE